MAKRHSDAAVLGSLLIAVGVISFLVSYLAQFSGLALPLGFTVNLVALGGGVAVVVGALILLLER